MAAATVSRLRWLVVVCAEDGAIAEVHGAADVGEAIRLRDRLELDWPAHTIQIGRLGLMLATELEEVAQRLTVAARAGGGLSETDRARRDGIAAAAVVVRARAQAVRRWAP